MESSIFCNDILVLVVAYVSAARINAGRVLLLCVALCSAQHGANVQQKRLSDQHLPSNGGSIRNECRDAIGSNEKQKRCTLRLPLTAVDLVPLQHPAPLPCILFQSLIFPFFSSSFRSLSHPRSFPLTNVCPVALYPVAQPITLIQNTKEYRVLDLTVYLVLF